MIDERFCGGLGTPKQHAYACYLASKLGYRALRYAVASALGISVSKCAKRTFTVREASQVIDWLKGELAKQQNQQQQQHNPADKT